MKGPPELALAGLIPLWRIVREEGVTALVTPSLDCVGALELGALDVRFAGSSQLEAIGEGLRSLVGSLDDECTLHFIHQVTEGSSGEVAEYASAGAQGAGPLHPAQPPLHAALVGYRAARTRWLQGLLSRRARVFLFFSGPCATSSPLSRGELGMPMLFANAAKLATARYLKQLKALATLRDRLASRLQGVSIPSRELSIQEVRQLHYELLNPNRAGAGLTAPTGPILDTLWSDEFVKSQGLFAAEYSEAEVLVSEDLEDARGFFQQGALRRRVCTLKVLPEGGTDYCASEPLVALKLPGAGAAGSGRVPFGYVLAVTVRVQPQGKAKWVLNAQHGLVEALRGALPFLSDSSALRDAGDQAKRGSIQALFAELTELSSKLVTLSVSLLLEAPSQEELDLKTEAARAAFSRAGNCELLVEDVAQLPAFLSMLPGGGPYQLRKKSCTSRNAADFVPLFAPWRGTRAAPSLFPTPSGELVKLDLFDKSISPVHHLLGVADSGSGKSMGAGALLIDALATGTEAILIDNGNSWKELTELFGGTHIPVELSSSISPFAPYSQMVDEAGALDNEAIAQAVRFLEVCAADLSFRGFDKPAADFVGRAIRRSYERRFRHHPAERPLISAFRDELLAMGKEAATERALSEDIARRLSMFCDGIYGDFLNKPSKLDYDAPLLTFDLANVSKDPILKPIAVAAIVEAVSARAAHRRTRTIVAIDEAHEFLADEVAARYVAGWFRKMRKYDVAMWALTQRFSDFLNCPVGPAIEGNAAIKFFLRHGSGHEQICSHFRFSQKTESAFRGLEFRGGYYSDALFLYGPIITTVRLALHPLAYWILTTDAEDKRFLNRAAEKNPHLPRVELIERVSRLHPHGVARSARDERVTSSAGDSRQRRAA